MMTELEKYFSMYISRFLPSGNKYIFSIEFYPYRSTFVKIFRNGNIITIRFNEQLKNASLEILKAGGREMIHRLAGKRALATDKVIFRQYINQLPVFIKTRRSHRNENNPAGKYVNLIPIFNTVNELYFNNSLKINGIGWTKQIVKSYYANYSLTIGAININRAFDHSDVPGYVLEYLMFHESLHSVFPPRMVNGRFIKHTQEFRRNEKRFAQYRISKEWLKKKGNRFINPSVLFRKIAN